MKVVTLNPTLEACVETQAKHLYNEIASSLLKTPENSRLENQFETLRLFLEQADFHKLRIESEPLLIDGKKLEFVVWQENGKARWEMRTIR